MTLETLRIIILLFGIAFSIFGGLVVFNDRFLAFLHRTIWKPTDFDQKVLPGKLGYYQNRYGAGLSSLVMGILFLVFFFLSL